MFFAWKYKDEVRKKLEALFNVLSNGEECTTTPVVPKLSVGEDKVHSRKRKPSEEHFENKKSIKLDPIIKRDNGKRH